MWNNIYNGKELMIDEMTENNIVNLRLSVFRDFHWSGERIIAPQLSHLTFLKKYNKIGIENEYEWNLIDVYKGFCLYVDKTEKYIKILRTRENEIVSREIYNLWEITE